MPHFTPNTVSTNTNPDGPTGAYKELRFSDAGGLTQFGAYEEILQPGSASAILHWHQIEDEMIYVLEGQITLREGDTETLLSPGDAATFKAGDQVGHCLENRSKAPTRCLIIGTRAEAETATYPNDDRILRREGLGKDATFAWTDLAGNPASNIYRDRYEARKAQAARKP